MVATSGDRLVAENAISAIASLMLPGAALVAPNAPEAEVLTGKAVNGINGQRRAAEALLERGANGALVKGGHIPGAVIQDVLQTQHGEWIFESARIACVERPFSFIFDRLEAADNVILKGVKPGRSALFSCLYFGHEASLNVNAFQR